MTPEMIDRARANAKAGGYTNVEFYQSTIDRIPLPDASVDCVISNCVLNLAPDKPAVFREIARVLKPGGRVAVSDIALKHELPEAVSKSIAAYVGCIAGAILIDDYRAGLLDAGFEHVEIVDSGADLNAYAKVENQAGCCSPTMDTSNPFQVIEEPCCSPVASTPASLHQELTTSPLAVRHQCGCGKREGVRYQAEYKRLSLLPGAKGRCNAALQRVVSLHRELC
jgi:arsenite methyltransferase